MISDHDFATSSPSRPPLQITLDRRRFDRLSKIITQELGIRMPPGKMTMLQSRLQRRMRELSMTSLDEYERLLTPESGTSDEMIHFFDVVTTNKTDFFREPQHFTHLAETALPTMAGEWGLESRWN